MNTRCPSTLACPTLRRTARLGLATVVTGQLSHGFVADEIRLAVFTAADLSGQRATDRASRKMPARRKNQIDPLELSLGRCRRPQSARGRSLRRDDATHGGRRDT